MSRLLAVPIFSSADRLRQGYGGPPKLQAAAEALRDTDVAAAAAIVNLVALCVTLLAVTWLVDRAAGPVTALSVATLFGVLPVVQDVFRMGLSEGLFVALCAGCLVALTWWMEDPAHHTLAPWGAALAIGAAMHVRYTGVFLVPVHVACASGRGKRLKSRATPIPQALPARPALRGPPRLSCLAGPLLGSGFLWYRLTTLGCMFCESRLPSTQSFALNVRDLGIALAKSLPAVYNLVPGPLDVAVSLGLLVASVLLQRRDRAAATSSRLEGLYVAGTCALVYLVGMLALRTVVEFNSLDPRLIAPAAFVALVVGLSVALKRVTRAGQWRVTACGVVMFTLAGVASDRLDLARTDRTEHWRMLSDPSMRDLAMVKYTRDHFARRPAVPLFTTDGSILQAQVGYDAPDLLPAGDWCAVTDRRRARGRHPQSISPPCRPRRRSGPSTQPRRGSPKTKKSSPGSSRDPGGTGELRD